MTASIVGESTGRENIPVTADRFSRFVIVKNNGDNIDLTGKTILRLPEALRTIESEAFAGMAAR